MIQRLGSDLVTHEGQTLHQYLDGLSSEVAPHFLDISLYGVTGDGSDETSKVQSYLDACATKKLSALIPATINPWVVGLVIDDRHSGMHIQCDGWFHFYGTGSSPVNKPANINGGAAFSIWMNGVCDLTGHIKVDGERTSKVDNEQVHSIGMYGGDSNFLHLSFKETRGDGIYVNHYYGNTTTETVNTSRGKNFPRNLRMVVVSTNTEWDGRNAVSLIAYKGCEVSGHSYRHGNGKDSKALGPQPGGLDVEPNMYWQSCYDLNVPSWTANGAGHGAGFCLFGKSSGTDAYAVNIVGVNANVNLVMEPIGDIKHKALYLGNARDIVIKGSVRYLSNTTGFTDNRCYGLLCAALYNFIIDVNIERAGILAEIGVGTDMPSTNQFVSCQNGTMRINGTHCGNGARLGGLSGVNIDLVFTTPIVLGYTEDRGIVSYQQSWVNGAYVPTTVANHTLRVQAAGVSSFFTSLNYGVRVNPTIPPTIGRSCSIVDSDLSVVPHVPTSNQNRVANTSGFIKGVIYGVTRKAADDALIPNTIWGSGDVIMHIEPTATYAGKRFNGTAWQNFGSLV